MSLYTQTHFRGYEDDAAPGSATAKAAVNNDWTQPVDENFRIRFALLETNSFASISNQFYLEYRINGGSWTDWSTSSDHVIPAASSYGTDDAEDDQQLISSGAFSGSIFNEGLMAGNTTDIAIAADESYELEFCLQLVGDNLDNGDTVEIRLLEVPGTGQITVYSEWPLLTVSKATKGTGAGNLSFAGALAAIITVAGTFLHGAVSYAVNVRRILSGALAPSGSVSRSLLSIRGALGAFSPSGILSRFVKNFPSVNGELAFAGASSGVRVARQWQKSVGGGELSFHFSSGAGRTFYAGRAITGATTLGPGSHSRRFMASRQAAGNATFSGLLDQVGGIARALSGGLSAAGSLARKFIGSRLTEGSQGFAGVGFTWFGIVTFMAGAVTYRLGSVVQTFSGVLSAAGELARTTRYNRKVVSKYLAGVDGQPILGVGGQYILLAAQKVLSFSGTALRTTSARLYSIAGVLGYTGALERLASLHRANTASMTPQGAHSRFFKSFRKSISGLGFSSVLTSPFYRVASATLAFAGTLTRSVRNSRTVEASIDLFGGLASYLGQRVYGILTATGALARKLTFKRSIDGDLTQSGIAAATWKRLQLIASGVLSFRGIIRKISIGGLIRRGLGRMGFNFKDD